MQILTSNFLNFGLDYIRVDLERGESTLFVDILLNKLSYIDDDNSNFLSVDFLDFDFTVVRSGDYFLFSPSADESYFNFPLFRLSTPRDFVVTLDIYSSFFHWPHFFDFLYSLSSFPHRLLRVDIALDFRSFTPDSLLECFEHDLSLTRFKEKDGISETIYIGDLKSKRKLVRLYDKKLDSKKKNKTEFYPGYFAFDDPVTRLEVELRSQACSSWSLTISKLLDPEFLYNLFKTELQTRFIFLSLPSSFSWYSKPRFERGVPDPILRLHEAFSRAEKKGVDLQSELVLYLSRA